MRQGPRLVLITADANVVGATLKLMVRLPRFLSPNATGFLVNIFCGFVFKKQTYNPNKEAKQKEPQKNVRCRAIHDSDNFLCLCGENIAGRLCSRVRGLSK